MGGGIATDRVQKLFLQAARDNEIDPAALASFAWSRLSVEGVRMTKDGKALESPADNLLELERQAAVERDLIANDVSRAKRAEVIDKMAAAYILQGALDRLQRLGAAPPQQT